MCECVRVGGWVCITHTSANMCDPTQETHVVARGGNSAQVPAPENRLHGADAQTHRHAHKDTYTGTHSHTNKNSCTTHARARARTYTHGVICAHLLHRDGLRGALEAQQAAQVDLAGELGGHLSVRLVQVAVVALGCSLRSAAACIRRQPSPPPAAHSRRGNSSLSCSCATEDSLQVLH